MKKIILKVENLQASIEKKLILNGLNFIIKEGETHVIMGPNGSGKSTLSKVLVGHPSYLIEGGKVTFCSKNLLSMAPELRAQEGLFLAFQHPIEIAGVSNYDFLRIAYNKKQEILGKPDVDPMQFMMLVNTFLKKLEFKAEFLERNLNEGFSGGEKKRNEILQMLLLEPKLAILDEIDSGLDIDALKIISNNITKNLPKKTAKIIITHYPPILNYIKPTAVHIMIQGKIVKSGGMELVDILEKRGYESFGLKNT